VSAPRLGIAFGVEHNIGLEALGVDYGDEPVGGVVVQVDGAALAIGEMNETDLRVVRPTDHVAGARRAGEFATCIVCVSRVDFIDGCLAVWQWLSN
jgi:hypothetical protein